MNMELDEPWEVNWDSFSIKSIPSYNENGDINFSLEVMNTMIDSCVVGMRYEDFEEINKTKFCNCKVSLIAKDYVTFTNFKDSTTENFVKISDKYWRQCETYLY